MPRNNELSRRWTAFKSRPLVQKLFRWTGRIALLLFALSLLGVIVFRFVPIPLTPLMVWRCAEQKLDNKPVRLYREWTPVASISDHMVLAVVCAEDQRFEEHSGFDFEAIEKVIEQNKKLRKKGRPIKGASTISQQVAKNVFLWPSRSWLRKGLEVYFTVLIEIFWSKERIMEVYLNVIEMGDGVYGVGAAAHYYFNKNAADLRPGEAALLAAILPNPRKWSPLTPPDFIVRKKNRILHLMDEWGGSLDLSD